MPQIRMRAQARRDLIDHFDHLEAEAGLTVADQFLREAEATLSLLATQPGMGAPLTLRHPALTGLRKWRVKGHDNVLIFYKPLPEGVQVIRVLHASRDWWAMLGLLD